VRRLVYCLRVLCPHGTSAKPARGSTMHTSQQSSEVVAAAAVADSDAPEVGSAGKASANPCSRFRPRCCGCYFFCRPAAVGTPNERRQNGNGPNECLKPGMHNATRAGMPNGLNA